MRISDPASPVIVGFEVPSLERSDSTQSSLFVALLNCEPNEAWVAAFNAKTDARDPDQGLAAIEICRDRIEFYGSISNVRVLSHAVRLLVEAATLECQELSSGRNDLLSDPLRARTSFERNR